MSQKIMVCWDTSQIIIDEDEFELIKMTVQAAGGDKSLKNCQTVIQGLKKEYGEYKARELVLLARGVLTGQARVFRKTAA